MGKKGHQGPPGNNGLPGYDGIPGKPGDPVCMINDFIIRLTHCHIAIALNNFAVVYFVAGAARTCWASG